MFPNVVNIYAATFRFSSIKDYHSDDFENVDELQLILFFFVCILICVFYFFFFYDIVEFNNLFNNKMCCCPS